MTECWTFIPLRDGGFTLVDAAASVEPNEWRSVASGRYVGRSIGRNPLLLHREVTGCTKGDGNEVHHRNGDPFDNRRCNLEVLDPLAHHQVWTDEGWGASSYRGVMKGRNGRWSAKAILNGVVWFAGEFETELEAATAAKDARGRLVNGELPPARVAKTHCKRGHEFTPENTYRNQGRRVCRICQRMHSAAHYRRYADA